MKLFHIQIFPKLWIQQSGSDMPLAMFATLSTWLFSALLFMSRAMQVLLHLQCRLFNSDAKLVNWVLKNHNVDAMQQNVCLLLTWWEKCFWALFYPLLIVFKFLGKDLRFVNMIECFLFVFERISLYFASFKTIQTEKVRQHYKWSSEHEKAIKKSRRSHNNECIWYLGTIIRPSRHWHIELLEI